MKTAVARFILCLSALVLALAGAEATVRLTHLAPDVGRIELHTPYGDFVESDNPVLRYVPRAGTGDINAYGLRDRDRPIDKPKGTFRVAVIGDSIGFGFCSDSESLAIDATFPRLLERSLEAARPRSAARVEVLNLCVSGYDTLQEVEFLRVKGLALSPDLVVVAYCLNDNQDASAELPRFAEPSPAARLGQGLYRTLFLGSHLFRVVALRVSGNGSRDRDGDSPGESGDRLHAGFRRLRALADAHGFEVLVVVFPTIEDARTYRHGPIHEQVRQAALAERFHHLDLWSAFLDASQGDLSRLQGRCSREHPDERGHAVAARAIHQFVLANRLVP